MKIKVLVIMGIILMVSAVFGVSERLFAKSPTQENVEHRAVAGTDMEAAVVNGRISYQGYLTDPATGNPLTGNYNMTFRLWDAASGGVQVGANIVKNNVPVADGLFNVTLDIPDETFDGQGRWIQLQVGGELLTPRREILPVPYALSLRPGALISGTVEGFGLGVVNTLTGSSFNGAIFGVTYGNSGNSAAVFGRSRATSGWNNGVTGGTSSGEGVGVVGYNTSTTGGVGVWGKADATTGWAVGVQGISDSSNGIGVIGTSSSTSGNTYGVQGESFSPNGKGVYGVNTSTTGYADGVLGITSSVDGSGVAGHNDNGTGIYGSTDSSGHAGVEGYNTSINGGWGVLGQTHATSGGAAGVAGTSHATTGEISGVRGQADSSDAAGTAGYNFAGGNGLLGITDNGAGSGVHGASYAASGYGVSGVNYATSGWGIGVYAETSSDGPAIAASNSGSGFGLWTRSVSGDLIVAYGSSDSDREFYVSNDGNVFADGTFHTPAADFAEMMPAHAGLEAGDVLIIGADGQLTLSVEAYQTSVVGVYSTAPGFLGGAAEDGNAEDNIPLAIVGIVPVKVSTENGSIQPGDLLTTSATPGYAMVCTNQIDCIGAIIGKALEPLTEGSGVISVLVTLQ